MQKPGTQEHKKGAANIIVMPLPKPLQRGTRKAHSGSTWREGLGPDAVKVGREFAQYLIEDGKSPKTIESYTGDVAGLLAYLGAMGIEFDG